MKTAGKTGRHGWANFLNPDHFFENIGPGRTDFFKNLVVDQNFCRTKIFLTVPNHKISDYLPVVYRK